MPERTPDLDIAIQQMAEKGFTLSEVWVLQPGEKRPKGTHVICLAWGWRLAFRHTKGETNEALHDTGPERIERVA